MNAQRPPKPLTRPATPKDVTATWLTKALQSSGVIPPDVEVASLRHEPLGGGTIALEVRNHWTTTKAGHFMHLLIVTFRRTGGTLLSRVYYSLRAVQCAAADFAVMRRRRRSRVAAVPMLCRLF